MTKLNYSQLIDKHFPRYFKYRSLRCLFDRDSSEWGHADLEKKMEILDNLLTIKPFEYWINDYQKYYTSENKIYVVKDIPHALFVLYRYSIETERYEIAEKIRIFLLTTDLSIMEGFERVYHSHDIVSVMGDEFLSIKHVWLLKKIRQQEKFEEFMKSKN